MDLGSGDDKPGGRILRSLLTSKTDDSLEGNITHWPELVTGDDAKLVDGQYKMEGGTPVEQEVVWQVEPGGGSEYVAVTQDGLQHIPVSYLTQPGDRAIAQLTESGTLLRPVTYHVVTENGLSEVTKFCAIDKADPGLTVGCDQKIVFIQDVMGNAVTTGAPPGTLPPVCDDKPGTVTKSDSSDCEVMGRTSECGLVDVPGRRESVTGPEPGKESQSLSLCKSRGERKISTCKTALKRRRAGAKKMLAKSLAKKPVKSVRVDEPEGTDDKSEDELTGKILFELTKLEDNVDQVSKRLKRGCDCSDTNCFDGLDAYKVFKHRLNIADLTKAEHDMYLMGVIMASFQNLEKTRRHKERIRIRSCYVYQGKKVCLTAFLYLQHVSLYQMKRIRSHLKSHGVSPRIHGNRGRKPSNTLPLDIYHYATDFVQNYIERHSVRNVPNFTTFSVVRPPGVAGSAAASGSAAGPPAGANTGGNNNNSKTFKIANKISSYYLPAECTKKTVHREYKAFCESLKPSQKPMKYSTFTSFLQKQFPNVKFQKVDKKTFDKACKAKVRAKEREAVGQDGEETPSRSTADSSVQTTTTTTAAASLPRPTVVYIPANVLRLTPQQQQQQQQQPTTTTTTTVFAVSSTGDNLNLNLVGERGPDSRLAGRLVIGPGVTTVSDQVPQAWGRNPPDCVPL